MLCFFFVAEEPGGIVNLQHMIVACLTIFLVIVIVVLAVKVRKLQRGKEKKYASKHLTI